MKHFKLFLESSTIHGLSYIASTEKLIRLFWIFVVITGFSGASFLIYQSFQSWADSPIVTAIETFPIEEVTFPKVTVCPPKDTYTNLNYDLMQAENVNISAENFEKLKENFIKYFQNLDYEKSFSEVDTYYEENKYQNWYNGKSKPFNMTEAKKHKMFSISTYSSEGTFATPYFGDPFNESLFQKDMFYAITLFNPYENNVVTNEAMIIEIEYDYVNDGNDQESVGIGGGTGFDPSKKFNKTIKANFYSFDVSFQRFWKALEYSKWKERRFTGMRIKWSYNSTANDDKTLASYSDEEETKIFIRMTNLVNKVADKENIWSVVKQVKFENYHYTQLGQNGITTEMMKAIETKLNVATDLSLVNGITEENLEVAAKMFTYIMAPAQDYWTQWFHIYENYLYHGTFYGTSFRNLVGTFARLSEKSSNLTKSMEVKDFLLKDFSKIVNLSVSQDIDSVTKDFNISYTSTSTKKDVIFNSKHIHKVSNHPVHLIDQDGKMSPSALVPFCGFGGNMSTMGVKIPEFDVPVCDSFKETILHDQLCYEVDMNKHKNLFSLDSLKTGLTLLVDINEDRQHKWFVKETFSEIEGCKLFT